MPSLPVKGKRKAFLDEQGSDKKEYLRQKKRTKTGIACDACQRRKSRCELVDQQGCHRCRVLGTTCSLTPENNDVPFHQQTFTNQITRASPPSTPLSRADGTLLERLDHRTARIESLIAQLSQSQCQAQSQSHSHLARGIHRNTFRSQQSYSDQEERERLPNNLHHEYNLNGTSQILGGLQLARRQNLIDPISAGMSCEEELRHNWKDFQATIDAIIPTDDLFQTTTTLSNPLLRCAILHFDPSFCDHKQLDSIIHLNLSLIPSCKPSSDLALALTVLSLSPCPRHRIPASEDLYHASIRALDIARSAGLDEDIDRFSQIQPTDLCKDWNRDLVRRVALYFTVVHRAAIHQFYNSPSCFVSANVSNPSLSDLLTHDQAYDLGPTFQHLLFQHELLAQISLVSAAMRKLRTARIFDPVDAIRLAEAVERMSSSLTAWRDRVRFTSLTSCHYLIILSFQMEMSACLRASSEISSVPFPLDFPDRSPSIPRIGRLLICAAYNLITFILDDDNRDLGHTQIGMLPSWTYTLCFLPYAALRSIKQLNGSQLPPDLNEDKLESYRNHLLASHPTAFHILEGIDKMHTDPGWGEHASSARNTDSLEPGSGIYDLFSGGTNVNGNEFDWWSLFDWPLLCGDDLSWAQNENTSDNNGDQPVQHIA
ncbi:uncharacterized protein I303_102041 [Kwoniella dejecticola CBS 10117]|uniref:Zn(2)-C6 fungal-type domain-containing protein n=1 Tax=Kwoniella dejecticola CBS 10117 TaxID=1296121 RepID=A0A1A6AC22_9TREE|nr:uncharacterized protein I303_01820 [Kwoniella dejecticola CBS 10117]OBR87612.1 hypothetical protein I303_01820 [Kwoniella dejecticola CBS 10117]